MRRVIGVLGHVDHGKTALVRALTGADTDRLPEEKRRGISIALGFAHLTLAGTVFDLIDMPGHERFVRTMVSGATGIDAALLVVAANEGVKPQTVEHLDIAALLGVRQAVVVAAKADLVAPAQAEAVARAAADLARRAGLAVPAAVPASAHTGHGMAAVRDALAALAAPAGEPPQDAFQGDDGFPYLPIDRAFSVAGHGTVVTGTLRRGPLAVGDEIELAPAGRPVRLRGLQVHGRRVAAAQPGQRVAANLRDVAVADLARGLALAPRALLAPSAWLTVALRVVEAAPPLRTGARLDLLFGAEELPARLRLLDGDEAVPGRPVLAQLYCAAPVSVPARERFILRRPSPPLTVAGGTIIDPAAARLRRRDPAILGRLAALAAAAPADILRQAVEASGMRGVPLPALARLAGLAPARAAALLRGASFVVLPPGAPAPATVVARAARDRAAAAALSALSAPALSAPAHSGGLSRQRLAAALPEIGPAVLDDALADLLRRGALRQAGGLLRPAHADRDRARAAAQAAAEARAAAQLAELLRRGGLSPPDPAALAPGPQARRLLDRLVRDGTAVRARDAVQKRDVLFHQDAVADARRRLAPLLAQAPAGLLVGEAGAVLGISRKYSVPLLEHLDSIRFTRRVADRRLLAAQP